MSEAIRFRIETIQSSQVSSDPDDSPLRIAADGLDVVMRETVRIVRMAIMTEFPGPAIQNVQSAAFRTYPQIMKAVLHDFSNNRRRQAFTDLVGNSVAGEDFIFGIEIVDSSEIGAYPDCTLSVADHRPDRIVRKSSGRPVGDIGFHEARLRIETIQPQEGPDPDFPGGILGETAYEIRKQALIRSPEVVPSSLCGPKVTTLIPGSDPQCLP